MKKVMGGSGSGTDAIGCKSDSDCPTVTEYCSGVAKDFTGKCYANTGTTTKTCHYGGCVIV